MWCLPKYTSSNNFHLVISRPQKYSRGYIFYIFSYQEKETFWFVAPKGICWFAYSFQFCLWNLVKELPFLKQFELCVFLSTLKVLSVHFILEFNKRGLIFKAISKRPQDTIFHWQMRETWRVNRPDKKRKMLTWQQKRSLINSQFLSSQLIFQANAFSRVFCILFEDGTQSGPEKKLYSLYWVLVLCLPRCAI